MARAALVVVALPDAERVHLAVRHVRAVNPGVPVLARAHEAAAHERLRAAGVTEVIQPEMEAAPTFIRHALRRLALPSERVREYLGRFRAALEEALPAGSAGEGLPRVREILVEGGPLADASLRESRVRERFGISVLTVVRPDGTVVHHPEAETIVRAGDRLRVFGLPDQIASRQMTESRSRRSEQSDSCDITAGQAYPRLARSTASRFPFRFDRVRVGRFRYGASPDGSWKTWDGSGPAGVGAAA